MGCVRPPLASGEDRTVEELVNEYGYARSCLARIAESVSDADFGAAADHRDAARSALLAAYRRVEAERDEWERKGQVASKYLNERAEAAEARAERLEKALRHGVSLVMLMLKDVTQFPQPGMERFIEAGTAALADQEEGR